MRPYLQPTCEANVRCPRPHRAARYWTAVLAAILLCNATCNRDDTSKGRQKNEKPVGVKTTTVEARTLHRTVSAIGTLQSPSAVEIRPEVEGVIRRVAFQDGDRVECGQTLYVLDDSVLQAQHEASRGAVDEARARLSHAEWNLDRLRTLAEQDAARAEELKDARDTYRALRARTKRLESETEEAKERLQDTTIAAPVAGRMTASSVDPGDYVEVGQKLAGLYPASALEVEFAVPERYADAIESGMDAELTAAAFPNRRFTARVTYVGPAVDPNTRTLSCKARVDSSEGLLRPGMFANVHISVETRADVPVIPEEALVRTRAGAIVYVVTDGAAVKRDVTIGLRKPGIVEIRDGVRVGETVVVRGHMLLRDGMPVRRQGTTDRPSTDGPPSKQGRQTGSGTDERAGSTSRSSGHDGHKR